MNTHPLVPWIDARMTRRKFAEAVNASESHLSNVLKFKATISLELAVAIERETGGEFTASRLFELQQQALGVAP